VIVVDSSVVLDFLLRKPTAATIESRLRREGGQLHAPHLIDVEVAHVLRRYAAVGELDERRAVQALTDLSDLQITRYPHFDLLPRIWELRQNLTAYDAAYIALAEALDATLLTRDRKLATAPGHTARVESF
jgi:predicted nucleic acid-binding protein